MSTKNTGFHREFKLEVRKILNFGTFSDLRRSDGQNWSDQETKLIHASRATRGYQNLGVSSNSTRYGIFPTWNKKSYNGIGCFGAGIGRVI